MVPHPPRTRASARDRAASAARSPRVAPKRTRAGVCLLDGVLVASLGVLLLMAWWPRHRVRDLLAAEDAVMRTMRAIGDRVDAHRAAARRDTDGDGIGETPPIAEVVTAADGFRAAADGAAWERGGYWYTVLVPGADRLARAPSGDPVTADLSEATYLLLAWPTDPGRSGMRAYLRSPVDGLLRHGLDGYPYGGPERPPAPRVALVERRSGALHPVSLRDPKTWVSPRETGRERDGPR